MKGRNLKSMMLSVIYYSSQENITSEGCQGVLIINHTKTNIQAYKRDTLASFEDEDWKSLTSSLEPGNKVEIMAVFEEGFNVEKTTVSLLYDEPIDKEMEQYNAGDEEDVTVSDYIDVPVNKNISGPGEDKHSHAVTTNCIVSSDDESTNKETEHCNGRDEEDVTVSGDVNKNVNFIDDLTNCIVSSDDESTEKETEHCNGGDEEDVTVSDDEYFDAPWDNNFIGPGEDKHSHSVNNNSSDDDLAANQNYAVSFGGDIPADKNVVIVFGEDENVSGNTIYLFSFSSNKFFLRL